MHSIQRSDLKRKRARDDGDDELAEPGLQRQILPIAAHLRADFHGEPQDGMEYLFTVRRASSQLPWMTIAPSIPAPPKVATASWVQHAKAVKAQVNRAPAPATVLDDTGGDEGSRRLPDEEWKNAFVTGFNRFRQNIQQPTIYVGSTPTPRYPKVTDRSGWYTYVTGRPDPLSVDKGKLPSTIPTEPTPSDPSLDYANDDFPTETLLPPLSSSAPILSHGTPPVTALLRSLDQKSVLHLLMYFAHWLNTSLRPPSSSIPPYPTTPFEPALSPVFGQWIFALLGHLDDRLMSGEVHTLRTLARACKELLVRSWEIGEEVALATGEKKDVREERQRERDACWIIIAAVAGVWGQTDIWDDAKDAMLGALRG
ncbi:hypothetical protein DACRYDRAFT_103514 [Dacryopinax primogenitus]|uniref:Uncharacterized protein n=1 Tax=Dacryopinax primogenitus (strain DJM 731) TaxID=1858805 RepID=M5GH39_DACPD|nr:uncharacterized protein DACRYDRAFT_103514 [Dacryopinax primogenitus]EJU06568.1 hypothetical protein DACRYDRAFT_103514 [Dacryopinax primogenitus]